MPSWREPSGSADSGSCTLPGSTCSQIAAELLPKVVELEHESLLGGGLQHVGIAEHVMYKPRWGAVYDTALERRLRESGSDTVAIGVAVRDSSETLDWLAG